MKIKNSDTPPMATTKIRLFQDKNVRTLWDADLEEWYFSVVDVIAVLTDSENPRNYWKVLKNRLKTKAVSWLQIVTNSKCKVTTANTTKDTLLVVEQAPTS